MSKQPLVLRLYYQPHMHELAKFVSYGGKREKDVKEKCDELRARFGDQKVMWALHGTCPPLENYRADLQDVVDGKRDTMPEPPDLRKYYMPR